MEEFKKIIARSFIEAYKKNPLVTSKTALSKKISEAITEREEGEPDDKHYKSLLNYYDYFFNEGKKQEPTETMINKLLNFLDYDSLDQFIKNQPVDESYLERVPFVKDILIDEPDMENPVIDIKDNIALKSNDDGEDGETPWKKIIITISFVSLISVISYFGLDWQKKDCMVWVGDRYKTAVCYEKSNLKYYPRNDTLIEEFRKIKIDNNTVFFENGKEKVWYKKVKGHIECFNRKDVHPIYRDSLKPITETIVRNYILKD